MRSGQGNPDEARSARYLLKDYVNGKLLFCHPPPGLPEAEFNEKTHNSALLRAVGKKLAPVTRVGKNSDTFVYANAPAPTAPGSILPAQAQGSKSRVVDMDFFGGDSSLSARPFVQGSMLNGSEFTRAKLYPHQKAVADDGTPLNTRQLVGMAGNVGKKHHKKMKKTKQRSGKGYD